MDHDQEVSEIKSAYFGQLKESQSVWIIEERDGEFFVHEWHENSISPPSLYPTARHAVARLMQLIGIGPVAPQTWPEQVEIGKIEHKLD